MKQIDTEPNVDYFNNIRLKTPANKRIKNFLFDLNSDFKLSATSIFNQENEEEKYNNYKTAGLNTNVISLLENDADENNEIKIEQNETNEEVFCEPQIHKSSNCLFNSQDINDVMDVLSNIDEPDFDIFKLEGFLKENLLLVMTKEIFSQKKYFDNIINQHTFINFIIELKNGYSRKNSYHNDIHAADVFQTVYVMFCQCDIEDV